MTSAHRSGRWSAPAKLRNPCEGGPDAVANNHNTNADSDAHTILSQALTHDISRPSRPSQPTCWPGAPFWESGNECDTLDDREEVLHRFGMRDCRIATRTPVSLMSLFGNVMYRTQVYVPPDMPSCKTLCGYMGSRLPSTPTAAECRREPFWPFTPGRHDTEGS